MSAQRKYFLLHFRRLLLVFQTEKRLAGYFCRRVSWLNGFADSFSENAKSEALSRKGLDHWAALLYLSSSGTEATASVTIFA